ncbi:hypothetical protein V8C35DRAFT_272036 [Trichoderma chlorosporum]
MSPKSFSSFLKGFRSKNGERRGQARSASNVPGDQGGERGQSVQLNRQSILPLSGPVTSTTQQLSMSNTRTPVEETAPLDIVIDTAVPQNSVTPKKKEATSPQELWDEAYDGLKAEQPKLIQIYEVILSNKLKDPNFDNLEEGAETNAVEATGDKRRAQMLLLIQSGQKRIKKESEIKESVGQFIEIVNSMKSIISTAIEAAPQAALPWSIVTMTLEIVQNPLKEQKDNKEGLTYLMKRMEWYWSLSHDLFNGTGSTIHVNNNAPDTQSSLLSRLVDLYKEIMSFQIKSICSFYRNRGLQLFRDVVMFDNWKESLKGIRTLELEFQNNHTTYMSLEGKRISHQIKNCLESLVALQVNNLEQHDRDCLRDLRITNPRDDRKRLLDAKGGLLPGSYSWVIESIMFQKWHREKQTNLLWIKGNPGKGKTMMICGLIQELEHMEPHQDILSYFFCQGTDPNFNNAIAVLRGIIYLLLIQKPSLIQHVQQEYKNVGSRILFDGINAWITLSGIFVKLLQDPALDSACLVVDALDECESDRKKLLELIIESTLVAPQVKWILSSRNFPDIEAKLRLCQTSTVIDLESNAALVSKSVDAYIRSRIQNLSLIKDDEVLQTQLQQAILEKSTGTFLWAALVFQEIEDLHTYDDGTEVLQFLDDIPSGLIGLYERMMNQIDLLVRNDQDRCRNVLATMAVAYQPLSLETLPVMCGLKDRLARAEPLKILVRMCGSFLTIRENIVYFVHQSAKDYLMGEGHSRIFTSGSDTIHRVMFDRSLKAMQKPDLLRPNIYSLPYPGVKLHEISAPHPDPLAGIQYCCTHWLQHFCDGFLGTDSTLNDVIHKDVNRILDFFKVHFLHWIEALSLQHNVQAGVTSLQKLLKFRTQTFRNTEALEFFQDAVRFILHNRFIIETAPLQTYVSALIFAPARSVVRLSFRDTISWIKTLPEVENDWTPCQYTLYCGTMAHAVFSNDGSRLITLSPNGKLRMWDSTTGELIPGFDLDFESEAANDCQIIFSDNSKLLAISESSRITIWNLETADQVHEFNRQSDGKSSIIFSSDSLLLAETHFDFVDIWDMYTGKVTRHNLHKKYIIPAALTPNFKLTAGKTFHKVYISDMSTGETVCELSDILYPICFSNNPSYLASVDDDVAFSVRHIPSGEEVVRYEVSGHFSSFRSTAFSNDSDFFAFGKRDGEIDIWDLKKKIRIKSYRGHTSAIVSVSFSRDAKLLVSGSQDGTVKVWVADFTSTDQPKSYAADEYNIAAVALSADGNFTATMTGGAITLWNRREPTIFPAIWDSEKFTAEPFIDPKLPVLAMSKDSRLIAMVYSFDSQFNGSGCIGMGIWNFNADVVAMDSIQPSYSHNVIAVAFSPTSEFLAAAYHNETECTVSIWRVEIQKRVHEQVVPTAIPASARIFVDEAHLFVVTDMGSYRVEKSDEQNLESDSLRLIATDEVRSGYAINSSNDWISWNGKDMIWLPGDFRPSHKGSFSALSSEIALGTALRGCITIQFEESPSEMGDWTPWRSSGFFL